MPESQNRLPASRTILSDFSGDRPRVAFRLHGLTLHTYQSACAISHHGSLDEAVLDQLAHSLVHDGRIEQDRHWSTPVRMTPRARAALPRRTPKTVIGGAPFTGQRSAAAGAVESLRRRAIGRTQPDGTGMRRH